MRLTRIAIQRFEVEVELAQVLRLKGGDFQFNGQQTVEAAMEEEQIQRKVLAADLQRVFGADIAEITAELGQKSA